MKNKKQKKNKNKKTNSEQLRNILYNYVCSSKNKRLNIF